MDNHGFTQLPNYLFAILPQLTFAEERILLIISRQTIGWHKEYDRISYSQFEKLTGLHRETISYTLKELKAKNLIEVTARYEYKVNWETVVVLSDQSHQTTSLIVSNDQKTDKVVVQYDIQNKDRNKEIQNKGKNVDKSKIDWERGEERGRYKKTIYKI